MQIFPILLKIQNGLKTMNLLKILKMTAVALLISGVVSSNAMAASTTGTADALVITPLTIESQQALNFGIFVAGTLGTVTIDLTGALSSTGVQTLPASKSVAQFLVTGQQSRTFSFTHDSSVNLSNGTDSMTASLVGSSAGNSGSATIGRLIVGGPKDFILIGGTLTVLGTESPGAYSGTFNISVDY